MVCRLKKAFLSVPFRMQRSGAAPPISASLNEREVLFVFAVIETGGKQYRVAEGDVLCKIETDKAVTDVESTVNGTLCEIVAQEGDTVEITKTIAWVEVDG